VPRYVYRLDNAIALALVVAYRPGEWVYSLRARSEAAAVDLGLSEAQALHLAEAAGRTAATFAAGHFPLAHLRPMSPEDPLLRGPYDLEARAERLDVAPEPGRRRVSVEVGGKVEGVPYRVSIGAIPEQIQALAEQISAAHEHTVAVCPVCGRPGLRVGETCDHAHRTAAR